MRFKVPGLGTPVQIGLILVAMVLVLVVSQFRSDIPLSQLTERYAPEPSRFIDVAGMSVHLRDEGTGQPVLLLHGMFASLHVWDRWTATLYEEYRVIRVDLPGHGLTGPRPDGNYRSVRDTDFILALVDTLGLERFVIVGNSFGGQVAWHFTLAYPERVAGLVLVNAAGHPPSDIPFIFTLPRAPLFGRLMMSFTPRWLIEQNMREVFSNDALITPAMVERYHHMVLRAGNRKASWHRINTDFTDLTDRLGEIQAPTLVLWGEDDLWIPVEYAERFVRDITGARAVIYPDVGHAPMEEQPELSSRDLVQFLSDITSGN
ncbi:MAG: alpha/beta hydrolase [Candidatus Neomarinimicrobiota bacterium]